MQSDVAILAGGMATRLKPITEAIPKALVDINGEPFIAHQLRLLRENGIERAVICSGHLGHQLEDFCGDGSRFGMTVQFSHDGPTLLGTGGALKRALPLLSEKFFVLYGDSYLDCNYGEVERYFNTCGKQALMTVFQNEGQWEKSNVEFSNGALIAYDKKHHTPAMRHTDYGLGVFHKSAFDGVRADSPYDLATLYQDLLSKGKLGGFEVFQRFYEIGSFAGLEELRQYLKKRTAASMSDSIICARDDSPHRH